MFYNQDLIARHPSVPTCCGQASDPQLQKQCSCFNSSLHRPDTHQRQPCGEPCPSRAALGAAWGKASDQAGSRVPYRACGAEPNPSEGDEGGLLRRHHAAPSAPKMAPREEDYISQRAERPAHPCLAPGMLRVPAV